MRRRAGMLAVAVLLMGLGLIALPAFVGAPPPARTSVAVLSPPPTPQPDATRTPGPAAPLTPVPTPRSVPRPAPPSPAPEPTVPPELTAPHRLLPRLTAQVASTAVPGDGRVAVAVVDQDGQLVFDHAADDVLLPASTQKLFVAAAALGRLGGDFRFRTEVAATGPLEGGVLRGDLVLHGAIDPALGTPTFAEQVDSRRPRTPVESLADQLVAAGLRRVTGRVLGDASILPHEPEAPGWLPRYLERGDAMPSSGLTIDGGRRLFVQNGAWHSTSAPDPASEAAAALRSLLRDRGVAVDGPSAAVRTRPATGAALATVDSPPLLEILRFVVQHSDNHLADGVFRALGRADGDGSWASAAAATRAALEPLDLDLDGAVFADGSGLSRDDRTTARLLAELDRAMTLSTAGPQWRSLMAVSGESGTLRRRLRGTVAEQRLRGKTGSLRDVRTLSGTVDGPEGTRYHFAVLGNDLDGAGVEVVRALQDDLVLTLAEDLYGCELVPVSPPEGIEPPDPAASVAPDPAAAVPHEMVCAA